MMGTPVGRNRANVASRDELEEFEGSDYEIDQWPFDEDVNLSDDGPIANNDIGIEVSNLGDSRRGVEVQPEVARAGEQLEVAREDEQAEVEVPTQPEVEVPTQLETEVQGQPETEMQGQGQPEIEVQRHPEIEVQREMTEVEVYAKADNANVDAEEMRLEWNSQLVVEWEIPVDPLNDVGDSIEPLFDDAGFDGMTNDTN
nr:hypothetical protein Itr_chr12CG11830 [Ipomoea trifida]